MTGDNPFADDDDDLDRTVVRPATGGAPVAGPASGSPASGGPASGGTVSAGTGGAAPTGASGGNRQALTPSAARDPLARPAAASAAPATGSPASDWGSPEPAVARSGTASTPSAPASATAPRFSQPARARQSEAADRGPVGRGADGPARRRAGSGPLSVPGNQPLGDPALVRDPALLIGASFSRLLDAAAPVLALIVAARDMESHPDPDSLLESAIVEVRAFETAALAGGHASEAIRLARYALCATMDDVVLATPWGGQTAWAGRGLVTTIHRETMSGERFFTVLDSLLAKPDENHDVLEVFYVCLSLGFEGRYRVMPRGAAEISRMRDRLYRTLTRDSEPPAGPFSPAARDPVARGGRVPGAVLPVWFPVLLVLAALVGIYALMSTDLNRATASVVAIDQRFAQPVVRAAVAPPPPQVAPAPAAAPAPEPPPPETTLAERLRDRLAGDIAADRVAVLELPSGVAVRIVAPEIFPSGAATATPELAALSRRIAQALAPETGRVAVLGHTDSIPMRPTARFADNTELSRARAQAVAEVIEAALTGTPAGAEPVAVRGLGSALPIADNATPAGRARNRRVEVILIEPATPFDRAVEELRAASAPEAGP